MESSSLLTPVLKLPVKLSYNPDKSDMITKELLDNVQREITTTFIGSGYRYSTENNSDMTISAFLDLDISTYEQHSTVIYDIVSKITLKAFDNKNNNLLQELTKNIFLSGNHLDEIILNSSRKSSSIAAKELIDKLEPLIKNNKSLEGTALSLKIEIIFQGDSNYKYFNHINSLLLKSPYNLKLIKRTFDPGKLFSLIVLSRVESDILANYIQENSPSFTNLELETSQRNKLVFNIVNQMQ